MENRNRESCREYFRKLKIFTITVPIYIITFTICDSQQKLFSTQFQDT